MSQEEGEKEEKEKGEEEEEDTESPRRHLAWQTLHAGTPSPPLCELLPSTSLRLISPTEPSSRLQAPS